MARNAYLMPAGGGPNDKFSSFRAHQMNMNNPLIPGTIQEIFEKGANAVESPYVQIIHLKSFDKDGTSTRYK